MVTRRPPTRLRVTFNDGTVISEQQASDTFALVLSRLGLERVAALKLYIRNLPIVGTERIEGYANQIEIDGKYICHHTDNKNKKKLLEMIARQLSASIVVELVPSA